MKRTRHTPEQIVRKLREADRLLAENTPLAEVMRSLGVSHQTYQRWRSQYGAMRPDDVARLKTLEKENARLKRLLAEKELDNDMLGARQGKMVTPNQKRVAVAHLVAEFGVSQRRTCLDVSQHRSTQRHCTTRSDEEQALRVRIRALAVKYPRYGYPCIHVMLLRDGFSVNRKRVQRLWRAEGLLVQRPKRRKPKVRRNPIVVRGAHPNHVWPLTFSSTKQPMAGPSRS